MKNLPLEPTECDFPVYKLYAANAKTCRERRWCSVVLRSIYPESSQLCGVFEEKYVSVNKSQCIKDDMSCNYSP